MGLAVQVAEERHSIGGGSRSGRVGGRKSSQRGKVSCFLLILVFLFYFFMIPSLHFPCYSTTFCCTESSSVSHNTRFPTASMLSLRTGKIALYFTDGACVGGAYILMQCEEVTTL